MSKSTASFALSLSALAIAATTTLVCVPPALAQTEAIANCDGCVNSKNIKDKTIKAKDLAPGVLPVETILVPAGKGASANCARLRNALAGVDDASSDNPAVIKLGRGTYKCGSEPVALKRFVTIEGAGRDFTTIIGSADDGNNQGVVKGANESALHHLSVEHRALATPGPATVINTGGKRMRLIDVAIRIDSTVANTAFGIFANGGSLELTDVSVQSSASNGQSQGIFADSGARLNMMNVRVHNQSGNFGNPAALELRDSSATGFGVLFSSNVFGILGRGVSVFELFDGMIIGGRGASGADVSFSCVAISDADFTARADDCS